MKLFKDGFQVRRLQKEEIAQLTGEQVITNVYLMGLPGDLDKVEFLIAKIGESETQPSLSQK